MKPNVLSIAVASGRIGYVYLVDGEVRDWGISKVAALSTEAARTKTDFLIETYRPDLVVTEELTAHTRKSGRTISNIQSVDDAAEASNAQHTRIERVQYHCNKYVEMNELAERYPVLAGWLPANRKLWENEDRRTIIWEALALVDQVDL